MKTIVILKKVFDLVPKLDPMVDKLTTNVKEKKIIKLIVRALQIGAAVYLLSKGLIDDEQAVDIIQG